MTAPDIRYRKLGFVELNVTDLERSRRFYQDMVGLQPVDIDNKAAYFRCDSDAWNVSLHQAPAAGLRRIGLMLEDERQFDRLPGATAVPASECAARGLSRAARLREPTTGAEIEFFTRNTSGAFTPTLAKIQRIGHIVMATPQIDTAAGYLIDALNFRVSDRIAGIANFVRPFPSRYHHGVGIVRGDRSRMHHLNFMVSEIDDIGRGMARFKKNDVPIVFGPGRHPPSESVFLYFLDPDGLTLEYSFGMEEFPEHGAREPRTLPTSPESIDYWGSPQDPRCGARGEIATG